MRGINYWISGSGKQVLVFLHGDTLDHRQWQNQVDYFAKKYTVLTYDLRGYGISDPPAQNYDHVQDLNNLLNKLQIDSVNLIGSSFGGEQAINFALTYPDKVKSLILISSSLSGFKSLVNWDVVTNSKDLDEAKEKWLRHEVFNSLRNKPDLLLYLKKIIADYNGHYWLNKKLCQRPTFLANNELDKILMPTLVMVGRNDLNYFKQIAHKINGEVKDSKMIIIENCGHLPNIEVPREVNLIIDDFLRH